ncbi:helix-turn-helix domain-containing protein [Streptomyces sp. 900116325]
MWDAVGLGETEGRMYEALLDHRQASADDLAVATGVAPNQARQTVETLAHLGLATRLPGLPARYTPTPPDLVASDLLAAQERRQRRIESHLQQLARTYAARRGSRHPAELIEVIEGAPNVRGAFRRLQRSATEQIRVFDRPPYFNPGGSEAFETNDDELSNLDEARIAYRVIYARSALDIPGRMADVWAGVRQGERARIAPALPIKLALADDTVALINSTSDFGAATAYLVHPSALLDALAELFETTWHHAIALNQTRSGDHHEVDAEDGRRIDLIGMLASGSTDEAVARAFGVSVRTVQRYIHVLMDEVGASTRLQLGMELVRRSWV